LPGNPHFSIEPDTQFYKEANEVYVAVKNATPEQAAIARFWSDDPMLSMTPPGHWVSIALQVAKRANLSLEDNVDLLARMGMAMSDAFVGCWREKYVYNLVRPITYIKKVIDPKWEPILNTPPFPEYPSGHSTVSGAMDAVLTAFFGEDYAFEDKTGSPDGRNPRSYKSFHEAAEEAGISRLYGGIHFRSAIVDGLAQGRCIGEYTNALKTRK
jgi:membrane-associated phospholipid phosphatase